MIVRELLTRLRFDVTNFNPREWEQGIGRVRNSADAAAESFRNMFLGFAGFSAIRSIAKTADEMQSLQARIGQLPQTVSTAGEAFDVVADRASAARQSIDAYGSFYVKLQNAGKDFIKTQEEGLQVTDTISKALILGGATAQEQSSALLQFGQAIGSGVLQGEELRAMSEAAPQFMDELAKAIGVPRAELKKFASAGKLTSKEVIEATKKMAVVFEARFKDMPLTIGTATTVIGNRWARFINKMNRESSAVTKIANFFLKTFDSIENGLADMVAFFGGSTNTLKFFGIALAAALAPFVFRAAAGAIAFLLSPMGLLLAGLLALGLAIEDFYQWMNGGKSVFGKWFGNFDQAKKKLEEFSGWITAAKMVVLIALGVMIAEWIYAGTVAAIVAARTAAAWIVSMARFSAALAANSIAVVAWTARLVLQFGIVVAQFIATAAAATIAAARTAGAWILSLSSMGAVLVASAASFAVWIGGLLVSLGTLVAGWVSSFIAMTIAAAPILVPILLIIAAITAVIAIVLVLMDNWNLVMKTLYDIATLNFSEIAKDFEAMVNKLKGYWNSFKSFFGFGASAKVESTTTNKSTTTPETANIAPPFDFIGNGNFNEPVNAMPQLQIPQISFPSVNPVTVAGAATAAGGVQAPANNTQTANVNVYQTLPPGTTAETALAASNATTNAIRAAGLESLARQMGQTQ